MIDNIINNNNNGIISKLAQVKLDCVKLIIWNPLLHGFGANFNSNANGFTIMSNFFDNLQKLGMYNNVKSYHIVCRFLPNDVNNDIDDFMLNQHATNFFNKLFFQDNNNINDCQNTKTISITITCDSCYLTHLARLFIYLNINKNNFYDNNNNKLTNIDKIIIDWKKIHNHHNDNTGIYSLTGRVHELFEYEEDNEYPLNQDIIDWNDCDFKMKSFGVMYKNVVNWYQRQHEINSDSWEDKFDCLTLRLNL